jgi:AraC family transcriptional regulator
MIKQFNHAMDYIEKHLADDIDFELVAQQAGCSEYHFRRLFSFLSGMPLSVYIRRRRLSESAVMLRHQNVRVIDLAVIYGYTSADAFSRAFQRFHGLTPTEARHASASVKVVSPIKFQLVVNGGNEMEYRLVEKDRFHIVGIQKQITLQYEGVNPEATAMWQSLTETDIRTLKSMATVEPIGLLSASVNFTEGRNEGTQLDQYIGVATDQPNPDGRWQVLDVPASPWVVFTVRGQFPETMQNTWARIFAEWFPSSEYELSEGPEILWNEGPDTRKPDYHSEIWLPVASQ